MATKRLILAIAAIPIVLIAALLLASVLSYAGGRTVEVTPQPTTIAGTLTISADGQCVVLVEPVGSKVSLLLPSTLTTAAGAIKDSSGTTVASAGDRVSVSGPSGGIGDDSCTPGTAPFVVQRMDRTP